MGAHALQESRSAIGHVFYEQFAAAVEQEAVEGRLFLVAGNGTANISGAARASGEDVDGVSGGVVEKEPGRTRSAWCWYGQYGEKAWWW